MKTTYYDPIFLSKHGKTEADVKKCFGDPFIYLEDGDNGSKWIPVPMVTKETNEANYVKA
jgi:hypothetical protein